MSITRTEDLCVIIRDEAIDRLSRLQNQLDELSSMRTDFSSPNGAEIIKRTEKFLKQEQAIVTEFVENFLGY